MIQHHYFFFKFNYFHSELSLQIFSFPALLGSPTSDLSSGSSHLARHNSNSDPSSRGQHYGVILTEFHCSTSSVLGLSRKCTIIANGGHQSIFWPSKEPLSIYLLCFIPAHSASSLPAPTPTRSPTPLATYSREHEQSLLRARATRYIHETKSDAYGPP